MTRNEFDQVLEEYQHVSPMGADHMWQWLQGSDVDNPTDLRLFLRSALYYWWLDDYLGDYLGEDEEAA